MHRFLSRKLLAVLLVTSFILSQAACGGDKQKTLAKAEDDFAQAQISTANLIKSARDLGELNENDVSVLKGILQNLNGANAEAINLSKSLITDVIPEDKQAQLLAIINKTSSFIVKLNTEGLLRIKDPNKKLAFSGFVLAMQAAASSVALILVKKGK